MSTLTFGRARRAAWPRWTLAGLFLGCIVPATSSAAPVITGADDDVWNRARPVPAYVISSTVADGTPIWWEVAGVASGRGRAPVTVRLPGVPDGSYRLLARERGDGAPPGTAERRFRVDLTPPKIAIRQPASGAQLQQGATVLADYACQGAVSCTGDVPQGQPLDTSQLGPASFAVRAADNAANEAIGVADYTIRPAATIAVAGSSPAPATGVPPPSAPITLVPPPAGAVGPSRPLTIKARLLRPRAGAVLTSRRPILRWPARRGVRLYNVQVFRLRATAITKVLSTFPRLNRMRVPPRRLAFGYRYVWRVWPYFRSGYPKRPLGLSYFDVRRSR